MTNEITNPNLVLPAATPEEAAIVWKQYEALKSSIVDDSDIQVIQGKKFLKKSYWRKIATFFNLSVETVSETHEMIGKTLVWHFTVKAIATNGRTAEGVGSCDAYEKATMVNGEYQNYGKPAVPNSLHNIRSTAETRAFNRAVSNLVGGGEVSAEEVEQSEPKAEVKAQPPVKPELKEAVAAGFDPEMKI